ncbi:MAG TPA: hypothetical protein VEX68_23340 [Bryobacteraceae bacterium]|nr:hypothetical protein [Bryobacteraceae bacterium]
MLDPRSFDADVVAVAGLVLKLRAELLVQEGGDVVLSGSRRHGLPPGRGLPFEHHIGGILALIDTPLIGDAEITMARTVGAGKLVQLPWSRFISSPPRSDAREAHGRWLSPYLPMVEEGTIAYLEINDSTPFAGPLPPNVVASVFSNLRTYLVLANYGRTEVTVETAWPFFPDRAGKNTYPSRHWKLVLGHLKFSFDPEQICANVLPSSTWRCHFPPRCRTFCRHPAISSLESGSGNSKARKGVFGTAKSWHGLEDDQPR